MAPSRICSATGDKGSPATEEPDWFALDADRPLFAFAGICRPWTGTRKGEDPEHLLFAFRTTEANDVVRPIHAKAMPVTLTGEGCDAWLEADVETAAPVAGRAAGDRGDRSASGGGIGRLEASGTCSMPQRR